MWVQEERYHDQKCCLTFIEWSKAKLYLASVTANGLFLVVFIFQTSMGNTGDMALMYKHNLTFEAKFDHTKHSNLEFPMSSHLEPVGAKISV